MACEIDATRSKKVDRILGVYVMIEVEGEIKLPGGTVIGGFAISVGEGNAELNDFEKVDVTAQSLVLKVGGSGADRTNHDARKLCVHGDMIIVVDEVGDPVDLLFQIGGPDLAYADCSCHEFDVVGWCCGGIKRRMRAGGEIEKRDRIVWSVGSRSGT